MLQSSITKMASSIAQNKSSSFLQGVTCLRKHQIIGEKYKIVRMIGEGGFGYGWLCNDLKSPTAHVFLKEMKWTTPDNVKWMEREAKSLAALKDVAYIPEMLFNFEDPFPSIIQEFVEGSEQLGGHFESKAMSPEIAEKCVQKLEAILAVVHDKKIIHRDIKPDNILIKFASESSFDLHLIDFGIGVEVNDLNFATATPIGVRLFMHPLSFSGNLIVFFFFFLFFGIIIKIE